jgi:hypothetical protein
MKQITLRPGDFFIGKLTELEYDNVYDAFVNAGAAIHAPYSQRSYKTFSIYGVLQWNSICGEILQICPENDPFQNRLTYEQIINATNSGLSIKKPETSEKYTPKKGDNCYYRKKSNNAFKACAIEHVGEVYILMRNSKGKEICLNANTTEFKEALSSEERILSKARSIAESVVDANHIVKELYDAGMLKMPGGE